MKTVFLATAALAIAGAGTVQAADIFTCSGLGYAAHNGRVELGCAAPVTTHWTKLGGHSSACKRRRPISSKLPSVAGT